MCIASSMRLFLSKSVSLDNVHTNMLHRWTHRITTNSHLVQHPQAKVEEERDCSIVGVLLGDLQHHSPRQSETHL